MLFPQLVKIYERFNHNQPLEAIFDFPIAFDPRWKSIAVSISGGADSALLCYILAHLATKHKLKNFTIHAISHIRCWKTRPWQEYDSLRVYNWMNHKFQNINFVRHVNFIPPELEWADRGPIIDNLSGDIIEIQSFAEYICIKNNVDAYFNGVTKNPNVPLEKSMPKRDIVSDGLNDHLQITNHLGKVAVHPFRFIDKSVVLDLYKKLMIMDLFEITRSCEGEFLQLDYKNYQPGQFVPTCNECFWCKEREWAIEQNK
jgi:hypothetical protein